MNSVNLKTPFIILLQRHITTFNILIQRHITIGGGRGGGRAPTFLRGGIAPTFCNNVPNKTSAPHFDLLPMTMNYNISVLS